MTTKIVPLGENEFWSVAKILRKERSRLFRWNGYTCFDYEKRFLLCKLIKDIK
jgi:hypothetical protein